MAFLSLLPMRPRPLKDENLDSWAMRLAHANATTATYFAKRVLGLNYYYLGQLDNRDDFQPIKPLELATGLSYSKVVGTTFSHFQWKIPGKERRPLVQSVFTSYNLRQRGFWNIRTVFAHYVGRTMCASAASNV